MRPIVTKSALVLLGIVVGVSVTVGVFTLDLNNHVPTQWFAFPSEIPESYSDQVITESDIPEPKIRSVSGKAKLVDHADGKFAVGYVVDLDLAPLNKDDLPDKYKQAPDRQTKGGRATIRGTMDEASYAISFEITLMDSDGFAIASFEIPPRHVCSGERATLQGTTEPKISKQKAALVDSMTLSLSVDETLGVRD